EVLGASSDFTFEAGSGGGTDAGEVGSGGGDEAEGDEAEGDEAGNGGGDEAEGDEAEGDEAGNGGGNEAGEAGNGGGNKAIPAPGEEEGSSGGLHSAALVVGREEETATARQWRCAAHSPDLLRPKSAAEQFQELQQATIGGLSEFLLQQAPADLNRIQVLEAGLARQKVQDEKSLCISKVLYEPINREAIEELAETRAAAQLGLA
ncbi:unnamed protein product, partial [Effrenium voratum]